MVVGAGVWTGLSLVLDRVMLSYGPIRALNDVSLELARGEFVGLCGPNGCGKSTLIGVASGVRRPDAGRVLLDGRPMRAFTRKAVATRVAVVPQLVDVQFSFTVFEVVAMGRAPYLGPFGTLRADDVDAVNAALQEAGCASLASRLVTELSAGELQRVAIARALAQSPAYLLLDEPTSHLDINYQIETAGLCLRLRRQGLGILAVLHDLNLALRYCDRLAMMKSGRVVASGEPSSVLTRGIIREVYGADVGVARFDRGEERSGGSNRPALVLPELA